MARIKVIYRFNSHEVFSMVSILGLRNIFHNKHVSCGKHTNINCKRSLRKYGSDALHHKADKPLHPYAEIDALH